MGRKFKPGESGNPDGSARVKIITDTIRMIANEKITLKDEAGNARTIKRLRRSAEALFDESDKGNVAAWREIAERLEGKVAQTHDIKNETTITHRSETLSRFDEWIAEASARPADTNGADVVTERSVLPDTVPPESTRH